MAADGGLGLRLSIALPAALAAMTAPAAAQPQPSDSPQVRELQRTVEGAVRDGRAKLARRLPAEALADSTARSRSPPIGEWPAPIAASR